MLSLISRGHCRTEHLPVARDRDAHILGPRGNSLSQPPTRDDMDHRCLQLFGKLYRFESCTDSKQFKYDTPEYQVIFESIHGRGIFGYGDTCMQNVQWRWRHDTSSCCRASHSPRRSWVSAADIAMLCEGRSTARPLISSGSR